MPRKRDIPIKAQAGAAKRVQGRSKCRIEERPEKSYFRIGEVAALVGVETHVIRFWEREFPRDVRPARSPSGQRVYQRRDVERLLEIKRLRRDENVGVTGARRRLRTASPGAILDEVRALAVEMLKLVDEDDGAE